VSGARELLLRASADALGRANTQISGEAPSKPRFVRCILLLSGPSPSRACPRLRSSSGLPFGAITQVRFLWAVTLYARELDDVVYLIRQGRPDHTMMFSSNDQGLPLIEAAADEVSESPSHNVRKGDSKALGYKAFKSCHAVRSRG